MRALRFHRFGSLDDLRLEEVPRPALRPGEILVQVRAASVNPSDVKNVLGKMEGTTLPRIPGRDFSGVVVEGPTELVGVEVWGAGGEVGFTRDGTHAEFVALPASGVSRKPASLDFAQAAACGVNFVTAWAGVHDALELGAGETILVTGARGGVGSSVIQLARWMGARTIGVDRPAPGAGALRAPSLRPDVALTTADDVVAAVMHETSGHGVDAVFDTVGSSLFETNLAALAHGGRYAIIASAGERRTSFDILDFYHKRLKLIGVDSRAIESSQAARILDRLRPGFETNVLVPPAIAERFAMADARVAYVGLTTNIAGKAIIEPFR
jgi:NADPH:quinone reductase-like Zn-dependent oxidoreductase